ncbi:MAG TPA: alpha/beta hydrolase [Catenuloplanes sp.]|jgi:pimeloyl-ACP methyl ester carboxylesterase
MRRSLAAIVALIAVLGWVSPAAADTDLLTWRDCHTDQTPARLQCATLTVPLDWSRPGGPTITLALNRLPATDPAHRLGPLLVNPGGPGGSGVDVVAQGGMYLGSPELRPLAARFDLIGFDPRGVGHSTPVRCPLPLVDPTVSPFPDTRAGYDALTRFNRRAGLACAEATGELIQHVDTRSAARDVEAIRVALGAPTISWLGVSYGTELGATYARLYPHRVRAMVLDGAVDHSVPTAAAVVAESRATDVALDRFAGWCAATPDCALHGRDVLADFDALTARADRGEIRAGSRPVTGVDLTEGTYQHLILRAAWPALARALAAATAGDASTLAGYPAAASPEYPAYRAIGCHDFAPRVTGHTDLRARAAAVRAVAPHTWRYSEFWSWTAGCAGWPVRAANPPRRERITGAPPILVVGNTYDPATPYAWATGLADRIAGSRLLTFDGDGHTALYNSACARSAEAAYLISGEPPAPGTVCRF